MNRSSLIILGLVVVIFITGISAAFTVRETEQVLVMRFGEPQREITEPGLHFKVPFVDTARFFDKRVLDYDADQQEIPTADQKQLVVNAFARYRITDPLRFFQTVGTERGIEQRFNSLINASLREVIGEVNLSVVLTPERARLMEDFTRIVAREAATFGIEVVDVRIKRIDLPEDNSEAIFQRMTTQRQQEARLARAEGDKEAQRIRAEGDKRQRVIVSEATREAEILRGKGDAEAQGLYNNAYGQDVAFFDFWRSMQAMEKGLGGDTTTFVGAPNSDFFRYFQNETGAAPISQ
ncbi:MAG TPA: protease modulator HflC [Rhodospirillaceae bacterium]|nr:protease modulator HflC [Rhodospirillaceae bacterium]MAX63236.1 protease modulator HflC [Rhodospirillaceae bacterium]MBB59479.1 protease modulator HflC [Rhodospirillaceae bacterium]HAE02088.1 protease modulator HflC [Rhodospirillaceae bacterium]HAJ20538.1 protease modulator HflC [Rhodospirillaceae bacterium]|tara:strand:- start:11208 stop:12089 length:882 start_codon:yes stop_codon:yes gene_type:complete